MRIIFMGTADFAKASLETLLASEHEIILLITQTDKSKGRGKKIQYSPIKEIALAKDLPIYQPTSIKSAEAISKLNALQADLIVVVAYGQIIPGEILFKPRYGSINVHASLLPLLRGAAPIQRAIMQGHRETGISIMQMDEGLDSGAILMQEAVKIEAEMDYKSLQEQLAYKGAKLLLASISALERGIIKPVAQDERYFTYAPMLNRSDELIDWSRSAQEINWQIRALSPEPGAYTSIANQSIKIFKTRVNLIDSAAKIASIAALSQDSFSVQTGEGLLEILELQKQGRKRMSSQDFMRGFKLKLGDLLGG